MRPSVALCSTLPIPRTGSEPPAWLHLLPAGAVRTMDGRGPYRVLNTAALMRASLPIGAKLPLDENHAIDLVAPKGGPAPARGWIVALQERADGIWGRVEWTPTGRRIMGDKAYAGVSPVIAHKADGTITALLRASLTNTPNLAGLRTLHSQGMGLGAPAPRDDPREIMRRARELVAEFQRAGLPIDLGSAIASIMDETAETGTATPPTGPVQVAGKLDAADRDIIARTGVDPQSYAETMFGKPADERLDAGDRAMISRLGLDPASYLRTKLERNDEPV